MLANVENYGWLIILPLLGVVFMATWNALNRHSTFSGFGSFMIALCVAMLFIVGVVEFFPQQHESPPGATGVLQQNLPSQNQEDTFHTILLPYLALGMSFLLLLVVANLAMFADGVSSFFRPFYGHKNKAIAIDQQRKENQITKVKSEIVVK
ncbi:MAG: hypothetical protein A2Y10_13815 [Planctomycetes bacterium GWF2_41_51]|nr:MAG: hypothetical protein A2Y10_13815 [Planctomycetes bacterium GWF2_41_51]HBG25973.1 hypothetical protein [Phycisphaerales bacterium]